MAKEKPLYISVDYATYKNSKSTMLSSQVDLLNSMKHIHNLKQIKDDKFKTKMRLYSLFSSLLQDLERIDPKLPDIELPKEKKVKEISVREEPVVKTRRSSPKQESIEAELLEIQEKLRKLNS